MNVNGSVDKTKTKKRKKSTTTTWTTCQSRKMFENIILGF